jgi:DnaJ-class molecular chaperone
VADPGDPYKILQVDPEAEDEVIQAAYRRLARKYHPDMAPGPEAEARMAAINAAWDRLGDAASRAAFDRERSLRQAHAAEVARRDAEQGASRPPMAGNARPVAPKAPEEVSRDWTSGRSDQGGGYDESMRAPEGLGAAGPPPGNPTGSVLNFGRYAGWSLGEIARHDLEYIEWLDRTPIGRP